MRLEITPDNEPVKWVDLYDGEVSECPAGVTPSGFTRPVKYTDLTIDILVTALQECADSLDNAIIDSN